MKLYIHVRKYSKCSMKFHRRQSERVNSHAISFCKGEKIGAEVIFKKIMAENFPKQYINKLS